MSKDKILSESEGGPYTVADRQSLYQLARLDLIQEFHEVSKEYRKVRNKILGIRLAIRGLSMAMGLPIPDEGQMGPILPEDREHRPISDFIPRNPPPGRSNLAPRHSSSRTVYEPLAQPNEKEQGNKDDKV